MKNNLEGFSIKKANFIHKEFPEYIRYIAVGTENDGVL